MKTLEREGADTRFSAESFAARQMARLNALGIIAETTPRQVISGTAIALTQNLHGMGVGLKKGDLVSNITALCQVAGATLTLTKFGLYNARTMALLAASADVSAAFLSTGVKISSMITPYLIPDDDLYLAAYLCVSAVTVPSLMQGAGALLTTGPLVTGGVNEYGVQGSQTDLPATASIVQSGAARSFYLAIS